MPGRDRYLDGLLDTLDAPSAEAPEKCPMRQAVTVWWALAGGPVPLAE